MLWQSLVGLNLFVPRSIVGSCIPPLVWQKFSGAARTNADYRAPGYVLVECLTDQDLNLMQWFYNMNFGVPGPLEPRRTEYRNFLGLA